MALMMVVIMWEVEGMVKLFVAVDKYILTKKVGLKMVSLKP